MIRFLAGTILSTLVFAMSATALAAADDPPAFQFPIACELGADCWIIRHPDVDPAAGSYRDHAGGDLTDDRHSGVDIGVADTGLLDRGVPVLASASGRVVQIRDGQPDRYIETAEEAAEINDIACGNRVAIDHGGGWFTDYCHLKLNSIAVDVGDTVEAGDPIALMGYSGLTTFPHVHISFVYEREALDPVTGVSIVSGEQVTEGPIWAYEAIAAYVPFALTTAGFATGIAEDLSRARSGAERLAVAPAGSPALVLYGMGYYLDQGDRWRFQIIAPDGSDYFNQTIEQDRDRRVALRSAGRRISDEPLQPGTYTGIVTVERILDDGSRYSERVETEIEIID